MAHNRHDDVPEPDISGFANSRNEQSRTWQPSYEASAVAKVCALLALPQLARDVRAEASARGVTASFALFDDLSGFPVRLRVGKLRRVRFITMPDLFDRFAKTPIGWALSDIADELDPADGAIGLVFQWAGIRDDKGVVRSIKGNHFMVAHTFPSVSSDGATRIVSSLKFRGLRHTVVVERLPQLVSNFSDWRPSGYA